MLSSPNRLIFVPCLHEISGGRIGAVSRFVEKAAIIAARANGAGVTRDHHLVLAGDEWAQQPESLGYNLFRGGIRMKKAT
jgi:hypothetical protein